MQRIDFNKDWNYQGRTIRLPHDAMLEQPRNPKSEGGSANAYFEGGEYIYEKQFEVSEQWRGKHILLQFEGVYKNCKVFVNGKEAGGADYGYIPFFVCLDHLLDYGTENVITVKADNRNLPNARWYTGGGIYRPVWLWIGETAYIQPEGIRVRTVSWNPAQIEVFVEHTGEKARVEIWEGEKEVASGEGSHLIFDIPNARLWSEDTPFLYTCKAFVENDEAEVCFGIRKLEWNHTGLYVNGKNTLLRGGCVHHDNGVLGAVAYDGAEYRRVKKLKEAGYNAIRSSHNPCSRAMLEACDEFGVYLIDEAWDMWFHHKNSFDYASEWRKNYRADLKAMAERDFNHPSVIMYSIGNEVSEPAKEEGLEVIEEMVNVLHDFDADRIVTAGFNLMIIHSAKKGKGIYDETSGGRKKDNDAKMQGMNSTMYNMIANMVGTGMNKAANSSAADKATSPALDLLDIAGYNYASGRYAKEGEKHPDRILYGSETFPQDIVKNWEMVKKYPYLIGDFMWTAWDYLGEAGIGAWSYTSDGKTFNKPYPWLLADCGAFDINGIPGAPAALAKAAWELDEKPWIGVQPVNHPGVKPSKSTWRGSNAIASWAWRNCDGNKAVIEVYSSAPMVEVLLNGKSLGKKKTKLCRAVYKTKYIPGSLEVIAYDSTGREQGKSQLVSARGKLQISAEVEQYGELTFVNLAVTDEKGIVESNADEKLLVTAESGKLLGFGSANPRTEENYLSGSFTTYYGRALAVVRGEHGKITVKSAGKTLEERQIEW